MTDGISLRRRLTWYVVVSLLLMTFVSGVLIYRGTTSEADEIFSASLVQTARILDGLISRETIESNRQQLMRALERNPGSHKHERKLFFAVLDADGQILLHSRNSPDIPDQVLSSGFSEFSIKDGNWFTYTHEASRDELRIVVGERDDIRRDINEYVGSGLLLPLIILLPLFLWLLAQIVRAALQPLQAVADQVRQQDLKDLKMIDVKGVPTEISPLVTALNQMIADLDATYARERRFVSDASHELRNPLASLLINVDNAIEESRDSDSIESLESMKTSIKRLSSLVAQLLELGHFENPQTSRELEVVDLGLICQQTIDSFRSRADSKTLKIEVELPDHDCRIMGVESLLFSLVSNLVDNAIKFSDPGCTVRLRCYPEGQDLVLAVDDSGAGLDSSEHEKVLGRFYRVGDTNAPGAGLGLSIVKSIAQIHAAQIEMGESELGGLAVRVRFQTSEARA